MVIAKLVRRKWVRAGSTTIVTITASPKGTLTTEEAATQAIAIATTIVDERVTM
ncbi:hypothetical protein Sjap_004548 [Stephania japonica]|uniref:Uncharacterized protein n=1 Tax=Stephania japonica TaxID=461633 RepID=A0AAP0K4R0_9MAGN